MHHEPRLGAGLGAHALTPTGAGGVGAGADGAGTGAGGWYRRPVPAPAPRRTVILATAARLFAERGYAAVSIDEIGRAVEASGPSLYWHFPNKQALLEAVVVDAAEQVAAAVAAAGDDPGFDDLARAVLGVVLDHPHGFRTLLLERHRVTDDHEQVTAAEARNVAASVPALRRCNPDLDDDHVRLRLFTQLGPLSALTPALVPPVARPRLEELVVPAIVALGAAPPAPRGEPRPAGGWAPARSRPEAVLHAARSEFRRRGFEQVTLHDIAAAAGLSRPSVYHYFRNKAEILEEAWRRELMRFDVGTWAALDRAASAADALDRLADAYVAVVLDCVDVMGVIWRRPPDGPDLHTTRRAQRRHTFDAWAAVLGELRPDLADAEVRALVEMTLGVAAWGALAVGGDHAWHAEIVGMTTAFARG